MAGGGDVGAGAARREGEWLRAYGRAAAMVPRVEALAAGRARLEAVNALQHESWEARDDRLQWRLLKADENMRMWEATCMAQQPSGDGRLFAELLKSENEDLEDFIQVLELENEELKIRVKEVEGGAGHCQNAAGHENIAGDLEAVLRQLNQVHEALIAEKDKEISALIAEKDKEISALIAEKDKGFSALIAEKDLVREQFMTLERDYADLHSYSSKQEAQVTEAKQELEQLQVAFQKKDDEIRKPRARAKAAEAKRKLAPEGKRQEMTCMPKETDGQIEKCKYRQPETSEKCKKDTSETHTKNCSQRPALRGEEMKICSSKQMLVKDGQPQTSLKRKCVTSLPKSAGGKRQRIAETTTAPEARGAPETSTAPETARARETTGAPETTRALEATRAPEMPVVMGPPGGDHQMIVARHAPPPPAPDGGRAMGTWADIAGMSGDALSNVSAAVADTIAAFAECRAKEREESQASIDRLIRLEKAVAAAHDRRTETYNSLARLYRGATCRLGEMSADLRATFAETVALRRQVVELGEDRQKLRQEADAAKAEADAAKAELARREEAHRKAVDERAEVERLRLEKATASHRLVLEERDRLVETLRKEAETLQRETVTLRKEVEDLRKEAETRDDLLSAAAAAAKEVEREHANRLKAETARANRARKAADELEGAIADAFPGTNGDARMAVYNHRLGQKSKARSTGGGLPPFTSEEVAVAGRARLAHVVKALKRLQAAAQGMLQHLWPGSVKPRTMSRVARWLEAGPARLDAWRMSAARAGATTALCVARSWYPDLDLGLLTAQRAGAEADLEAVAMDLAIRSSDLAGYASWDEFIPERTPEGEEVPEDLFGLLVHDPAGSGGESEEESKDAGEDASDDADASGDGDVDWSGDLGGDDDDDDDDDDGGARGKGKGKAGSSKAGGKTGSGKAGSSGAGAEEAGAQ